MFHNVRVSGYCCCCTLHHLIQFLNYRLLKNDDVTCYDLTDLTNMVKSRDPPDLKRAFSQNYYVLSVTPELNNVLQFWIWWGGQWHTRIKFTQTIRILIIVNAPRQSPRQHQNCTLGPGLDGLPSSLQHVQPLSSPGSASLGLEAWLWWKQDQGPNMTALHLG